MGDARGLDGCRGDSARFRTTRKVFIGAVDMGGRERILGERTGDGGWEIGRGEWMARAGGEIAPREPGEKEGDAAVGEDGEWVLVRLLAGDRNGNERGRTFASSSSRLRNARLEKGS